MSYKSVIILYKQQFPIKMKVADIVDILIESSELYRFSSNIFSDKDSIVSLIQEHSPQQNSDELTDFTPIDTLSQDANRRDKQIQATYKWCYQIQSSIWNKTDLSLVTPNLTRLILNEYNLRLIHKQGVESTKIKEYIYILSSFGRLAKAVNKDYIGAINRVKKLYLKRAYRHGARISPLSKLYNEEPPKSIISNENVVRRLEEYPRLAEVLKDYNLCLKEGEGMKTYTLEEACDILRSCSDVVTLSALKRVIIEMDISVENGKITSDVLLTLGAYYTRQ